MIKVKVNSFYIVIPLILGILARILYLLADKNNPFAFYPIIDEKEFFEMASEIVKNGPFSPEHFWHPPLYSYFLAFLIFIGFGIKGIIVVQMIIGLSGVLLLYLTLEKYYKTIGLIASICWAVFPLQLFLETRLLSENLFIFMLLLFFWFFCLEKKIKFKNYYLALLVGLLVVTRSQFIIILLLWIVILFFIEKEKVKTILAVFAISLIFPLAVSLHNYSKTKGKLFFISSNGPVNLYLGNSKNIEETLNIRPIDWKENFFPSLYDEAGIHFLPADTNKTYPYLLSKFLIKKTLHESSNLQVLINNFLQKTFIVIHSSETPRNYNIYDWRSFNWYLKLFIVEKPIRLPLALFLYASLIFLFISWRQLKNDKILLFSALIIFGTLFTSIIFFNAFRYRLTVVPWIIATAVMFYKNYSRIPKLMIFNVVLIVIFGTGISKSFLIQKIPLSETYRLAGDAMVEKTKFEKAMIFYEKSRNSAEKENAPDYVFKAITKKEINVSLLMGDNERAKSLLNKATENGINDAMLLYNKALSAYESENYYVAIENYTLSIQMKDIKVLPLAYHGRALCFIRISEKDKAFRDLDSAILLKPDYAEAWSNRGILKGQSGDALAAINDLSKAIQLNPEYIKAYTNRGIGYLSTGKYTMAIQDFSKALQIDSLNPEAYYLRGMALIETGKQFEGCQDLTKSAKLGFKKAEQDMKTYCK